jgi:transposase
VKDEGIDGLKEKQRSGRPSKARNQNHTKLLQSMLDSFWHCFVGEKNDYYTLLIVLLFFEFGIRPERGRGL